MTPADNLPESDLGEISAAVESFLDFVLRTSEVSALIDRLRKAEAERDEAIKGCDTAARAIVQLEDRVRSQSDVINRDFPLMGAIQSENVELRRAVEEANTIASMDLALAEARITALEEENRVLRGGSSE